MVLDGCLDALDVMNFGEELGIQVRLEGSYNEFKKASKTTYITVEMRFAKSTQIWVAKQQSPGKREAGLVLK